MESYLNITEREVQKGIILKDIHVLKNGQNP